MPPRLRDRGEHRWIARLIRALPATRQTLVGPGDDAAAIRSPRRSLLLTTDTLVEGTHFRLGWESPGALGRRALRVNVSDVAAMVPGRQRPPTGVKSSLRPIFTRLVISSR